MIQAIIIDDEKDGSDALQLALNKYCPDVQVLKVCHSAEQGLNAIQTLTPNLIFLDILMPGMSGFDLLQQVSVMTFEVIFVTAYDKYAIKAIKFSGLDYLLKPIDIDDLMQALKKVKERLTLQSQPATLAPQSHQHQEKSEKISRLAVPSLEGIDFLEICKIIYCKAEGNYTLVYLKEQSPLLISKNLKDFEKMLVKSGFCRVHHSYLINIQHVRRYIKGDGGYVIMTGEHHVDISRRKKDEFLKLLDKL